MHYAYYIYDMFLVDLYRQSFPQYSSALVSQRNYTMILEIVNGTLGKCDRTIDDSFLYFIVATY